MMKRIIVLLIAVCMLAAVAIAQTAAPAPAPSTTPQAAAPTQTTPLVPPRAKAKGKHAGNRVALRDIDDPRVKELVARHHSERKACKANSSAPGCAEMLTRQKSEKRALMMQLRKEGKI